MDLKDQNKIDMKENIRLWSILTVVMVADMLDMLDSTITNIAAPVISKTLGGGQELMQWLGAGYALTMGVLLVVGGRLGDKYGQRKLFLIGMAGFTLASLACGIAVSPEMIIVARLVQGAFGALLIPQGMAIMAAHFPREMMTKAFSVFGPVLSIATICGPILAGFLIRADIFHSGWRSIFLINIVIGTLGFIAAYKILPKDAGNKEVTIDGIGSVLLGGMMLSLLYGIIDGSANNWQTRSVLIVITGIVLLLLFIWRQIKAVSPIIKPTLFKNRGFSAGLFLGFFFFGVVAGLTYLISLFLQLGLGSTPFGASMQMVPLSLGIIVSSILTPPLIEKIGRNIIGIGLIITLTGLGIMFYQLNLAAGNPWAFAPSIFLMGGGMGFCFGTLFDFTIGDINPEEAGSASGSLSAVQQLSSSIGAAVITSVFFIAQRSASITSAMERSFVVIAAAIILCLALVRLLPVKTGNAEH
ncbi:MFS transporter [Pararcticibacter amylolyticus]|uniref:MFS transporter n=2 Tax=Pararcticibacter amylolyticus TaxID=2173175 RepID=A0A2U2PJ04_9SPHI|nr:MFS transporter [Pararcticibacter amylolyticus]